MAYASGRKDPEYRKVYRRNLRQDHVGFLRAHGVACVCVACGVADEDQPLDFLTPHTEVVPFKELVRRADMRRTFEACQRSPLACFRCRSNWRAGLRRQFPELLHDSLDGRYTTGE